MKLFFVFFLLFSFSVNKSLTDESIEEINLKLVHLQVLFRHGDRAPLLPLDDKDPFIDEKYWPNGFEELTNTGRARMFRLGEFIRHKYHQYLGNKFSPREIFARSSSIDRCLESAQLVLAGSYPPNSTQWQWQFQGSPSPLAQIWQPIPIVSYVPANDDAILRMRKPCPAFDNLKKDFFNNNPEMIQLLRDHKATIDELSSITGKNMTSVLKLDTFHENILIEHEHGYFWSDHIPELTREREMEITEEILVFSQARWNNEFRLSPWAKRNRAGGILTLIGENFRNRFSVRDLEFPQKIVILSSHDTKLVSVMEALNVWNQIVMPYSSTLFFELYQQNITQFYVRVQYFNETGTLLDGTENPIMYPLELPECYNQTTNELGSTFCPLEQFLKILEPLKLVQSDIQDDCGIDNTINDISYMTTINILLLVVNLAIFFVLLLLLMYFCTRLSKKPGYQPLE